MTRVRAVMAGDGLAARGVYAFGWLLVVGLLRLWNRVEVHGRENIPRTGPFVLAPVHRSNLDTPFAAASTRRRLRFMGKDSLWKVKPIGWVLSAVGGFPVTRGTADREALRRCLDVLEGGAPVVLFPEGERKSGPLVFPLFDGPAYLAGRTQAPIVPVGIGGSERAMPKGSKLIKPVKVHVVVGEPIPPPTAVGKRVSRVELHEVTERLHDALQLLFDDARARAGD